MINDNANSHLYDADGNRVAKGTISTMSCDPTSNGFQLTASYVLDEDGSELTQQDGSGNWQRTNVYVAGRLLATYDLKGLHFHLTDPLGTRRMQVSGALNTIGVPETDIQSLPYGDALYTYPDPYAPPSADDATPLHFTGKERDSESGNDYFEARYYASSMGRFLSPDYDDTGDDPEPVPYADFENPQSLNLYGYVNNNPLSNTDSSGHDCVQESNMTSQSVTVTVTAGGSAGTCSGTFVNGTVNMSSLTYNGQSGDLGYSFSNYADGSGSSGNGVIGQPASFNDSLMYNTFGPPSASTWNNAAGAVNTLGGIEMTGLSIAMPELLSDAAVEGGLTGGAKLGEAAANRINHIFQAKHKLDALIRAFGSKQAAYEALASATEKAVAGGAGPFEKLVQVGGQSVTVRGAVIDGVVKISTAFVR